MKLRFDENDDVVLDDIPDDMIADVAALADSRGVSEEELWRELLVQLAENWRER